MKKLCLFILSIFLSVFISSFLNLDSYALTTVEPLINGFSNAELRYMYLFSSNYYNVSYNISENSAYNRYGIVCYYVSSFDSGSIEQWCFANVFDLLNAIPTSQEPFAYVEYETIRVSDNYVDSSSNLTWKNLGSSNGYGTYLNLNVNVAFTTDFPVFSDRTSAINYYRYGLLDEDSVRYGSEYISNTNFNDIVYDPLQIPAPHVEWVSDSNGDFTHQLHFLNNGYFGEHNTQLYYGLLLSMHWLSVNDASISIANQQGVYTRYQFTASNFCLSDQVDIYKMPTGPFNFNDYACPPYLNLDTVSLSVNAFNQLLSDYPINSRNFVSSSNQSNANFVLNTIKGNLSNISYKLNCPIVSCQYFVIDEQGNFLKGPITKINIKYPNPSYFADTGAPLGYDQSENQTWNPETDTPINQPTVINPPSAPNPGPQSPIQIPDYSDVDATDLVNNMNSLFSMVGQIPSFIAQLFSFLPEWLIIFIAVSIGIVVAIGVVKLFLG